MCVAIGQARKRVWLVVSDGFSKRTLLTRKGFKNKNLAVGHAAVRLAGFARSDSERKDFCALFEKCPVLGQVHLFLFT
jgi:hypothetical protein